LTVPVVIKNKRDAINWSGCSWIKVIFADGFLV